MPQFVLTAALQLQSPKNLGKITAQLRNKFKNVSININVKVSPAAKKNIESINSLLANLRANASATQATLSGIGVAASKTGTSATRAMTNTEKSVKSASKQTQALGRNMQVASSEVGEFGRQSALAIRRFLAFSIPAGIVVGMVASLRQGVKAAIDFNRQMLKVQQVTGNTIEGVSGLRGEIFKLSTGLGVSSGELVNISRILAQTGLSANDTRTALDALAKSSLAPTFESMEKTSEGAIAAMRQFKLEAKDLEGVLSSINAVAGSFAVESGDLIEVIRRAGGVFEAAGGNLNELLALYTSIRATTRESASAIATGLRTITARLQRPRTIKFLADIGIDLQEEGRFVGMFEAVKRLNNELKGLDPQDVRYAQIVEQIAGFRQISRAIPLVKQLEATEQAYAVAQAGSASIARDAAVAQENLSIKLTKLGETWNKLYQDIIDSDTFQFIVDSAIDVGKAVTSVVRSFQPILPLIGVIGGLKGAQLGFKFAGGFGAGITGFAASTAANTTATSRNTVSLDRLTVAMGGTASRGGVTGIVGGKKGGRISPLTTIFGVSALSTVAHSMIGFGDDVSETGKKLRSTIDTLTKLIITVEATRFALGAFRGAGNIGNIFGGARSRISESGVGRGFGVLFGGGAKAVSRVGGPSGVLAPPIGGHALPSRFNMSLKSRAMSGILHPERSAGYASGPYGFAPPIGSGRVPVSPRTSFGSRLLSAGKMAGPGLAIGAGAIAGGSGILLGQKLQQDSLKEARESAKTGEKRLRELEKMNSAGVVISGISTGAIAGAAVGSFIPGIGTGIGAGIGAVGGGIYGALQDNTEEIRQLNRESRFTEATETLSKRMAELLEGRSRILGTDLNDVGEQLRRANQNIIESFVAGDITQAKQREAALTKQLIHLDKLSRALADSSEDIGEFGEAGDSAGKALIETMANIRGVSFEKVSDEIDKMIKDRKDEEDSIRKVTNALDQLGGSLNVLRTFGDALLESNEKLRLFTNNIEFGGKVARGQFAEVKFGGRAGFGKFGRAAGGRVFDEQLFKRSVEQAFIGLPEDIAGELTGRALDISGFIKELPQILRLAGATGPLGEDYLLNTLSKQLEKFDENENTKDLVTIVMENVRGMMKESPGTFFGGLNNPEKLVEDLIGKDIKGTFDEMESIAGSIKEKLNSYLSVLNKQTQVQNEILSQQLNFSQAVAETSKELFELRRPGERFGVGRAENVFARQQQLLLQNVRGVRPNANPQELGNALFGVDGINDQLKEFKQKLEDATTEADVREATSKLNQLGQEAFAVTQALNNFSNITLQTTSIMDEINRLEEARKTKFGLLERYAVGGRGERQQILRTIYNAFGVSQGRFNLEDLLPDMRKEVIAFLKEFRNIRLAALGGKTGGQALGPAVIGSGAFGNVQSQIIQKLFGVKTIGDLAKVTAQPLERSEQEQNLINKLGTLYKQRENAELQFINGLKLRSQDLSKELNIQIDSIGKEVVNALLISQKAEITGKITSAEAEARVSRQVRNRRELALGGLRIAGAKAGFDESFLQSEAFEKTMAEMIVKIQEKSDEIEKIKFLTKEEITAEDIFGVRNIRDLSRSLGGVFLGKGPIRKGVSFGGQEKANRQEFARLFGRSQIAKQIVGQGLVDEDKLSTLVDDLFTRVFKGRVIRSTEDFNRAVAESFFGSNLLKEIQKTAQERQQKLTDAIIPIGKLDDPKFTTLFKILTENLSQIPQLLKELPPDTTVRELNTELGHFKTRIDGLKDSLIELNKIGAKHGVSVATLAKGGRARGTDTVPAMLTPGEFVVNRKATQKNLGLLKQINSGDVQYAAGGGLIKSSARLRAERIAARRAGKSREVDENPFLTTSGSYGPSARASRIAKARARTMDARFPFVINTKETRRLRETSKSAQNYVEKKRELEREIGLLMKNKAESISKKIPLVVGGQKMSEEEFNALVLSFRQNIEDLKVQQFGGIPKTITHDNINRDRVIKKQIDDSNLLATMASRGTKGKGFGILGKDERKAQYSTPFLSKLSDKERRGVIAKQSGISESLYEAHYTARRKQEKFGALQGLMKKYGDARIATDLRDMKSFGMMNKFTPLVSYKGRTINGHLLSNFVHNFNPKNKEHQDIFRFMKQKFVINPSNRHDFSNRRTNSTNLNASTASDFIKKYQKSLGVDVGKVNVSEASDEQLLGAGKQFGLKQVKAFATKSGIGIGKFGISEDILKHEFGHIVAKRTDILKDRIVNDIIDQGISQIKRNYAGKEDSYPGGKKYLYDREEVFANMFKFADQNPKAKAWRDAILTRIQSFHGGGFVPGSGDVPAILQGGEYVVPKQAFQQGGVVQNQKGGQLQGVDVLGSSIESFGGFVSGFSKNIESFGGIVEQMKEVMGQEITMSVQHGAIDLRADVNIAGIEGVREFINSYVQQEVGKALDDYSRQLRERGPV